MKVAVDQLMIRIVLATDLGLVVCKECLPASNPLPLLGSDLAQLGLTFCIVVFIREIAWAIRAACRPNLEGDGPAEP